MNGTGASERSGHPNSVAPRRQTRFSRIPRKIKMLTHPVDYETPEPVTSVEPTDLTPISLTAETIAAIADLDDDRHRKQRDCHRRRPTQRWHQIICGAEITSRAFAANPHLQVG